MSALWRTCSPTLSSSSVARSCSPASRLDQQRRRSHRRPSSSPGKTSVVESSSSIIGRPVDDGRRRRAPRGGSTGQSTAARRVEPDRAARGSAGLRRGSAIGRERTGGSGLSARHPQVDHLHRLARQREAVLCARGSAKRSSSSPQRRRRARRRRAGPRARSSGRRSACRPSGARPALVGVDAPRAARDSGVARQPLERAATGRRSSSVVRAREEGLHPVDPRLARSRRRTPSRGPGAAGPGRS